MFKLYCFMPMITNGHANDNYKMLGEVVEHYESGEEAVKDCLSLWHEDDNAQLFVVHDEQGRVWATIARGLNPNDATVSKTDGASQRFRCAYRQTADGIVCDVTSLS